MDERAEEPCVFLQKEREKELENHPNGISALAKRVLKAICQSVHGQEHVIPDRQVVASIFGLFDENVFSGNANATVTLTVPFPLPP